MKKKGGPNPTRHNYGIIADTVTASSLAVGENAIAQIVTVSAQQEQALIRAMSALGDAIHGLALNGGADARILKGIDELRSAVQQGSIDQGKAKTTLTSIVETVKGTGTFLSGSVDILELVPKLAGILGISRASLSL